MVLSSPLQHSSIITFGLSSLVYRVLDYGRSFMFVHDSQSHSGTQIHRVCRRAQFFVHCPGVQELSPLEHRNSLRSLGILVRCRSWWSSSIYVHYSASQATLATETNRLGRGDPACVEVLKYFPESDKSGCWRRLRKIAVHSFPFIEAIERSM